MIVSRQGESSHVPIVATPACSATSSPRTSSQSGSPSDASRARSHGACTLRFSAPVVLAPHNAVAVATIRLTPGRVKVVRKVATLSRTPAVDLVWSGQATVTVSAPGATTRRRSGRSERGGWDGRNPSSVGGEHAGSDGGP